METTHWVRKPVRAAVPRASAVNPGTEKLTVSWQPAAFNAPIAGATLVLVTS